MRTVDQKGGFPWPASRPRNGSLKHTSEAQNDETGGVASVERIAAAASGDLVHVKIQGVDGDEDEDDEENGRERSEMEDSFVDMYMHLSKCSRSIARYKPLSPLQTLNPSPLPPSTIIKLSNLYPPFLSRNSIH